MLFNETDSLPSQIAIGTPDKIRVPLWQPWNLINQRLNPASQKEAEIDPSTRNLARSGYQALGSVPGALAKREEVTQSELFSLCLFFWVSVVSLVSVSELAGF